MAGEFEGSPCIRVGSQLQGSVVSAGVDQVEVAVLAEVKEPENDALDPLRQVVNGYLEMVVPFVSRARCEAEI